VTAQAFPGLYHEIFNEPEREQVLGHLLRWLERFRAAAPNEEPRR
jgi:alpha-beta hydrolase superfamily lysophospholipase